MSTQKIGNGTSVHKDDHSEVLNALSLSFFIMPEEIGIT
jgi:hypothetical protein